MSAEISPNRAVEAVLPEDLELTPQPAPQPVEAPPPEVLPAEAAEDRGAFAFLKSSGTAITGCSSPASWCR